LSKVATRHPRGTKPAQEVRDSVKEKSSKHKKKKRRTRRPGFQTGRKTGKEWQATGTRAVVEARRLNWKKEKTLGRRLKRRLNFAKVPSEPRKGGRTGQQI